MVIGEAFDTENRMAYLPVELFHRLHELDEQKGGDLIDSITYVPSRQRTMRRYFSELDPELRRMANSVIEDDGVKAGDVADRVADPRDAVRVLNALLAYYEYRVEGERPDVSQGAKLARASVIRARLQLPPSRNSGSQIKERRSPAQGAAPMMLGGGGLWRDDGDGYGHLEWSPFHYDLMGFNGLEWSELVVLDTSIGIDAQGDAFLDNLDVIRVRNLNARATRIAGEDPWSWNVQAGFERASKPGERTTRAFANGGIGVARPIGRSIVGYVSLDGWLYSNPENLAAGPNAGVIFQSDNWKWWVRGGARLDDDTREWREHATVEMSMKMSQHRSVHLALSYDGLGATREDRASLTLRQHF